MSFHHWFSFLIAVFVICGSPGPNMLHIMASSASYGIRNAFYAMLGCFLAVLLLIGGSVAGVGALLKLAPGLFDVLRWAGALYLIYLGVQAWRSASSIGTDGYVPPQAKPVSPALMFRKAFLVGLSNPKALLFAAAFFPQFINPAENETMQLLILLLTFSVMEFGWYIVYALGGNRLAIALKRDNIRKAFQRLTGGLFALFGTMLLVKSS